MKNIILLFIACPWIAASCYREENPGRSQEPENVYSEYTLPQGNHPYDANIVEFFRQYNTLILYRYQPSDIYWNETMSIGAFRWDAENPANSVQGYYYTPADEEYIGEQLVLIREKFLRHFTRPEVLRGLLPKKIFLADTFGIQYLSWAGNVPSGLGTFYSIPAYMGIDYMLFSWGGRRITTMTAAEKNTYKYETFNNFFAKLVSSGKLVPPAAFSASTDYSNAWPPAASRGALGVMPNQNGSLTPTSDWNTYISVIARTPVDVLLAQPTIPASGIPSASDFTGYLHPDIDVNGKIREKYQVILDYFDETFGIDLQGIGNDLER
ncbi:MAG: hypothetical protein LBF09_03680 [Odoribacteraceae bacterium]|jgi:hypothetical protein|nr:hypothetical protein [Odoribacteraceae bacterium]